MRIRRAKHFAQTINMFLCIFFLTVGTMFILGEYGITKKALIVYFFSLLGLVVLGLLGYGVCLIFCKTCYNFQDDYLQITRKKKILHNIAYDKIIRVEHHAFMPTMYIIELPFSYIKINYYNEKGKQKQAELYCSFRPLRKLKNFPMNKVIKL